MTELNFLEISGILLWLFLLTAAVFILIQFVFLSQELKQKRRRYERLHAKLMKDAEDE